MAVYRLLFLPFVFISFTTDAQLPGFVSIDCGGTESYTDDIGIQWIPDSKFLYGATAAISVAGVNGKQYQTLRYFPVDSRKYCYKFDVKSRIRYLVRATFLYGSFDKAGAYPKFDITLGATHWSTVAIYDSSMIEVREMIFLANSDSISVCMSNSSTGSPFISTLEHRRFNDSMYYHEFETQYFLSVSARINFGANSALPIRYPDDPFDRIWESDSVKKPNYLVDVASGTTKVSTIRPVEVNNKERPPGKVMQTAVVGRNGTLNYRLNLDGFPGSGWAFCYFAEIEDLGPAETRKFKLVIPYMDSYSKFLVNIQENAPGNFNLYEPGFPNMTLPYVFTFSFVKTPDSSRGPILNAFEINKYVQINPGSQDAPIVASLCSRYPLMDWAQESGDPCLPVPWSWVQCTLDQQPRIASITLSGKKLTGNIPPELPNLTNLVEFFSQVVDNNSLTGSIPDLSGCINLKVIHLENNLLTGAVPSFFATLPNLKQLYLQNNKLSGVVPAGLISKEIIFNFSGNPNLRSEGGRKKSVKIIGALVATFVILACVVLLSIWLCARNRWRNSHTASLPAVTAVVPSQPVPPLEREASVFSDTTTTAEGSQSFLLSEIEFATGMFGKKVGSGGFGTVYYGKLNDGREIAVKVLSPNSYQGKKEFLNEVSLLSRIHHRNLVAFLGYCQEKGSSILIYEYMHNGTLKEHLYGHVTPEKAISWTKRLEIAADAAKGIEYLHTGCVPTIIHRDLKTSNILLDNHMRAKVSDFGLSKVAVEGSSHVSSVVRGTVGYLDPDYGVNRDTQRIFTLNELKGGYLKNPKRGKTRYLVSLLSRIHHRNLVAFLGYCQEKGSSILIYEYMHNGTLKEHLYGHVTPEKAISWTKRLEIAADAAKGIEYLHTGCVPTIIHRDLKTSNILLDNHMRAKVSDFGLSKVAVEGSSHVSSVVRGTVGYLDPEYYISQQLTEKSDVYSFGVILLELISGQEAILNENFSPNCRNIVQWAKMHIESGDIQQIIDPSLCGEYDVQSMWKIAEQAMMCVQHYGRLRPTISEVLKEIQEAISIEKGSDSVKEEDFDYLSRNSRNSSTTVNPLECAPSDPSSLFDDSVVFPTAR